MAQHNAGNKNWKNMVRGNCNFFYGVRVLKNKNHDRIDIYFGKANIEMCNAKYSINLATLSRESVK